MSRTVVYEDKDLGIHGVRKDLKTCQAIMNHKEIQLEIDSLPETLANATEEEVHEMSLKVWGLLALFEDLSDEQLDRINDVLKKLNASIIL